LFQPPVDVNAPYLFVWAIMLYIGWTLIAVPYTAWGAELSDDYDQRSKITGAREGLTLIGILAAGAIPALTASIGWTEAEGLSAVSWLAIIVGAPAIAIMLLWLPEPDISGRQAPQQRMTWASTKYALAIISSNKPFVRLLSAWFINGMANGIPAALFLLYLEYGLGADAGQRSILILAYFLSGVLSIPVWLKVSNRIGKHRAWCWAMVLTCLAFACVPFLSPGDLAIFTAICIVTGTGLGADLSLPPALQADVIDFDRLRSGKARAGLFFALWSMSTKMALALAVGITFPALELLGFTTDSENSLSTLWSLSVIYAWVPVVLKIVAIALIWTFPITRERQELIRRRLERRHRQPT
jgi:GPH family glycoside/pentoside/hexuronide:cation symporter